MWRGLRHAGSQLLNLARPRRNAANMRGVNTHRRLLIACLTLLLPVSIQAAAPASLERIIVKWRSADSEVSPATAERVRDLGTRVGQNLIRGRNIGGRMSVMQLDRSTGTTLAATLRALRADPEVEFAEPDRWMKIQAYTPSDPLFVDSLAYMGQIYERQWYLKSGQIASIRADSAWDITRGGTTLAASTVVVAVIDTGVRLDHPDLADKLLPGYDFISVAAVANDGNGWDADPSDAGDFVTDADLLTDTFKDSDCTASNSSWHGTRVSGLLAANTDNGQGIAGAGFNIRILPARALGKCGGFESDVIAAMYWAAGLVPPPPTLRSTDLPQNAHPAQILNLSLGSEGACSATYATAVRDVTAHGVLVVASAGNKGQQVGNPASCAGVLAVAGLRHVGTKVGYSNLGPEVGIAAPAGNCVFVTLSTDPCVYALNTTTNLGTQGPQANSYSGPNAQPTFGTSFSSPLVAATAGLMKTVNPALTPVLLIARIKETARTFPATSADAVTQPPACALPSVTPEQAAECICTTQVCGAGMLNAAAAVQAAQRPAVFAQATGSSGGNRQMTLDGSQSAAAAGRSITSYLWTVDSTSGGAAVPIIASPAQAQTTVQRPTTGSFKLRLTVTDNLGGSDSAVVTVMASGGSTSTSPPPSSGDSGGGGGGVFSTLSLLLAAMLLLARSARRPAALRT
jgi:serine protease